MAEFSAKRKRRIIKRNNHLGCVYCSTDPEVVSSSSPFCIIRRYHIQLSQAHNTVYALKSMFIMVIMANIYFEVSNFWTNYSEIHLIL